MLTAPSRPSLISGQARREGVPQFSPDITVTPASTVTGSPASMQGVTYAIVAKSGSTTKKGSCKTTGTTKTCSISSLPKGKTWKVSITTKLPWQATAGGAQSKKFTF